MKLKLKKAVKTLTADLPSLEAPDRSAYLPYDFSTLLGRLDAISGTLPPLYDQTVFRPFVSGLWRTGPEVFATLVDRNQPERSCRLLITDIAQALLQYGEGFKAKQTDAAQEVVSDLFDGFLGAADRRGVKLPERLTAAPLVKWGPRGSSPYVFPSDTTGLLGIGTGVVNLPSVFARRGLAAWATLPHEVSGHEILRADRGLRLELSKRAVDWIEEDVLAHDGRTTSGYFLAQYLSQRIDEAAADVLGILNMGPAALVALIAFFRANNPAGTLSGDADDVHFHPPAFLRALIMLETIKLCDLGTKRRRRWVKGIRRLLRKDRAALPRDKAGKPCLCIGDRSIRLAHARIAARSFARAVAVGRLDALEGVSLSYVQNWRDVDEDIVEDLALFCYGTGGTRQLAEGETSRVFAAHAVAGAIRHVVWHPGSDTEAIFRQMIDLLAFMHRANPVWNELAPVFAGDIAELGGSLHVHPDNDGHSRDSRRERSPKRVRFVESGAYEPDEFSSYGRAKNANTRPRRTTRGGGSRLNNSRPGAFPSSGGSGFGLGPQHGPMFGWCSENTVRTGNAKASGKDDDGGFESGSDDDGPMFVCESGSDDDTTMFGFASGGGPRWGFAPGGGVPWGFAPGGGVPWGFAPGGGVPWGFAPGGGVPWGFAPGGGVPWGFASGGGVPWGIRPIVATG